MMRRDLLLTRLRESGGLNDSGHEGNRITDMHIELDPADHEEPTWEVRHPGAPAPKKRLDRRTRMILGIASAAAVVVNAGAAWSYWQITRTEVTQPADGPPVELTLRARSDLNQALTPGATGDLIVTVTNDNSYPIKITSVTPAGTVVADPEHEKAGCKVTGVRLSRSSYDVLWQIDRNSIGAFNVPGGLTMRPGSAAACRGATFTVPLRVSGVRQES
ncbi:hypothetical protein OWR29_22100 [Actinoplanes sp. Pm04-4]|uniref:Uncharacterized protein n=1 Tax=Paractinoplanes pyxinae TaxID=2997416 RepID=A0ABT4B2J1_9ACTN|nr:hypothetical protein [Actinoplanes pyxinae]MCY1140699.1 hypothetical protein [Actinoplanes pyxinae]